MSVRVKRVCDGHPAQQCDENCHIAALEAAVERLRTERDEFKKLVERNEGRIKKIVDESLAAHNKKLLVEVKQLRATLED